MNSTIFIEKLRKNREFLMKEIDRVLNTVRDIERTLIGFTSLELIIVSARLFITNIEILVTLLCMLAVSASMLFIARRRLIKYYMKLIEMDPPDVNMSPFGLIAIVVAILGIIALLLL